MEIVRATLQHLDDLAPLFDAYRMFYRQSSNIEKSKTFLTNRIKNNESVIYIAYIDNKAVGFTQLYSLFSSVSMEPMYLLNDLFVNANVRNKGVGQQLIQAAKSLCIEKHYKGLAIQTEVTNPAQHLYERVGFIKDPDLHLFWKNK
ncbi:GNAT family N-acetyltransferase [Pontimicrobium aquaticum]|uniref:GNAT family N-acetyltransferase n=1 Tax=Pontimicrobium aquaticum TaxID=2565367 RepID=A0A4U0EW35_9FLAO|nr:GNAT family N-acetyltransferase [Pontimicrobium aquaticum]TJY36113.1 GNAT family N-acetyltransferase [Pontimicrobium aquaticum]